MSARDLRQRPTVAVPAIHGRCYRATGMTTGQMLRRFIGELLAAQPASAGRA